MEEAGQPSKLSEEQKAFATNLYSHLVKSNLIEKNQVLPVEKHEEESLFLPEDPKTTSEILFRFTYNTNKLFRRLDAIARIVVGDEICAAVCFVNGIVEGKKIILIATNRDDHPGDNNPLRIRIKNFQNHIKPLALVAHCAEKSFLSLEEITPKTRLEFARGALGLLLQNTVKILKMQFDNVLEKRDKMRTEKFKEPTINSIPITSVVAIEFIIQNFNQFLTENKEATTTVDTWFDFNLNEKINNDNTDWIAKRIKRFFKDLLKIEESFANCTENSELIEIVAKGYISFEIVPQMNSKNSHAEMRLIEHLLKNNYTTEYIGISRLCCCHCHVVITNMKDRIKLLETLEAPAEVPELFEENVDKVIIDKEMESCIEEGTHNQCARGFHGKMYSWSMSAYFKTSPELIRAILGDDLFRVFNSSVNKDKLLDVIEKITSYKETKKFSISPETNDLINLRKNTDSKHFLQEEADTSASAGMMDPQFAMKVEVERKDGELVKFYAWTNQKRSPVKISGEKAELFFSSSTYSLFKTQKALKSERDTVIVDAIAPPPPPAFTDKGLSS